jgi:hypothetical protein
LLVQMSQRRAERQCGKLFGSAGEECIGSNDESAGGNWTKDAKAVSISRAAPLGFGQTAQFELCDAGRSLWGMFAWLRCGHHTQRAKESRLCWGCDPAIRSAMCAA